MTRVAVVGHVEWVDFVALERFVARGGLEQGRRLAEHPGGGAVVAAGALAELDAQVVLFCALADDERGHAAHAWLTARGIEVHATWRPPPTRYALTMLDPGGERTIVTVGERQQPSGTDALPWDELSDADGLYFTAGDDGALHEARRARRLVVTPRAGDHAGGLSDVPRVDATVFSAGDPAEVAWARDWEEHSAVLVATEGARGGRWWGESSGRWSAAAPPAVIHDSYGAGDAFAAGLTLGLARGGSVAEAVAVGAQRGAAMLGRVGAP